MKKLLVIIVTTILLSACSSIKVVVKPNPTESVTIPVIITQNAINIKNIGASMGDVKIGRTGTGMGQMPKKLHGDLHQWSQTAVEMLEVELKKSNIVISADASKVMNLSVIEAQIEPVPFLGGNKCNLTLKVVTGENSESTYSAEHTDPDRGIEINLTAETAMTKALAAMLSDTKIIDYLQN